MHAHARLRSSVCTYASTLYVTHTDELRSFAELRIFACVYVYTIAIIHAGALETALGS